ncbi:Zinc-binding protein A33 [Chelonia mydas]|uniref:Zinc-binding protein A33 n=1 Tax=Chelonia mydas TaxID=8469 RepID=M7B420_CHEMY|nr:Zinc-binding protein A33 [Chelonia mydas]
MYSIMHLKPFKEPPTLAAESTSEENIGTEIAVGVMELSASSGLWAFAFFCHIGILVSSESFTLKGSDSPVIATVGADVILPCQLSPRTNAKQMEVRWHSSEIAGLTHHYVNGHDALQKQNPHYRGRTELFKEGLPNGNVSLLLKKVQVADGGSYVCFIGNKLNYLESLVELKVGGKLQIAKELLKARNSAVQIRADPNTAHPNLHISSDCLHVSHSDQKQEVTDTLERFDGWACVLGSETLRAGKEYYWEVYVGNKTDWDLGVTDGKANRKGWQNLKPENGYWGIRFFNSTDYIAFEDPEVKLKLGKQPKVVGIHLDGKAQRLDFYDVSDMSHIYTFSLKFPLDVYPYFCPGLNKNGKNKDPLNLCFLSHDYSDLMSSTSISSPHISTSELLEGTNGKDVAVEHSNLKNSDDATLPFLHQAPFIQKQEPSPQSGSMHKLCIGL